MNYLSSWTHATPPTGKSSAATTTTTPPWRKLIEARSSRFIEKYWFPWLFLCQGRRLKESVSVIEHSHLADFLKEVLNTFSNLSMRAYDLYAALIGVGHRFHEYLDLSTGALCVCMCIACSCVCMCILCTCSVCVYRVCVYVCMCIPCVCVCVHVYRARVSYVHV